MRIMDIDYITEEELVQVEEQEEEEVDEEIVAKGNKSRKRKIMSDKNNINKGIILSLTKPSYTLKTTGERSLRCLHESRLRYLLQQLIRRQNWSEASGVLSVLLKATMKNDKCLLSNKTKYWAALEIYKQMGGVKPRKIKQLYEIYISKCDALAANQCTSFKGRFNAMSEYLVYCISQGNNNDAHQAAISLQQESDFQKDSIANMVVGLTYSQLWYTAAIKNQIIGLHDSNTQTAFEESVYSFNDSNDIDKDEPEYVEFSDESDEAEYASRFPHTGNKQYASIFFKAHDLEHMLMPYKLPITDNFEEFMKLQREIHSDHYKAAVNHLRGALHSTDPASDALLPLIQMLLFGDQVKEAMEVVESIVQNSHAALPFRLRASLVDHFSNEDANTKANCFEDALRMDPTCSHSLTKLTSLHHAGYYSVEKLVEMIAMYLGATFPEYQVWKEFAECIMKLREEDRMSTCDGDSYVECSKRNPLDAFKGKVSRETWKIRCRWWKTRHFTQTMLQSEIDSGKMELVTYKAASACHVYGPDCVYVLKAAEYLKTIKYQDRSILKQHMEHPIKFYKL